MNDPAVLVLRLEQGDRSLEDHTEDFVFLANYTHYPDSCLCSFYQAGLNAATQAQLSREGPRESLAAFIEWVLVSCKSALNVDITDDDTSPTSDPEPSPLSPHSTEPEPTADREPELDATNELSPVDLIDSVLDLYADMPTLLPQTYEQSVYPELSTCSAATMEVIPLSARACERSGAWSERGAERAKYSRSAERVFIQRPERSLCLAPVPLQYHSHHEPRACTNPPRIHLCLQQLTKLSAYTPKIVRCEGEMEFVKYFQKQTDRSYRCTIPVKNIDDNDVEHDQECGDTISVSKDSYFNLKRHIMRNHDSVLREHGEARAKREHFEYG